MEQVIKPIHIKDLVLWTENPRDPISVNSKDQDVANLALDDKSAKWSLIKLAKDMGDQYDFSELPTVVYHGKTPIVYDGNRRVLLAKLKHGYISFGSHEKITIPDIPEELPCNVCSRFVGIKNVYRKHADSGTWMPLERDIFLNKYMNQEKSPFLLLEETTGIITENPHLNKRFVKEEIFTDEILKELGFDFNAGKMRSIHEDKEAFSILNDIANKVEDKVISTRENRGKVFDVLNISSKRYLAKNKGKKLHTTSVNFKATLAPKQLRQTKRVTSKNFIFFGEKLYMQPGETSNLYRDICDLYGFYIKNKSTLSQSFPSLLRMSLRLICETASTDKKILMTDYIKNNFAKAKSSLSQDQKTTMSTNNVTETSIIQLLHTGAHNYTVSSDFEKTKAMSIIIGAILKQTHGK